MTTDAELLQSLKQAARSAKRRTLLQKEVDAKDAKDAQRILRRRLARRKGASALRTYLTDYEDAVRKDYEEGIDV